MPPAQQTAVNDVRWERREREFAAAPGEERRKGRKEGGRRRKSMLS